MSAENQTTIWRRLWLWVTCRDIEIHYEQAKHDAQKRAVEMLDR